MSRCTRPSEDIYKSAPRTSGRAYRAAQEALKESEELYYTEKELDHLLPKELRTAPQDKSGPGG